MDFFAFNFSFGWEVKIVVKQENNRSIYTFLYESHEILRIKFTENLATDISARKELHSAASVER